MEPTCRTIVIIVGQARGTFWHVRQIGQCTDDAMHRSLGNKPLLLGLIIGVGFGLVDLTLTLLYPLEDDTPGGTASVLWTDVFRVDPCRVSRGAGYRATLVRC